MKYLCTNYIRFVPLTLLLLLLTFAHFCHFCSLPMAESWCLGSLGSLIPGSFGVAGRAGTARMTTSAHFCSKSPSVRLVPGPSSRSSRNPLLPADPGIPDAIRRAVDLRTRSGPGKPVEARGSPEHALIHPRRASWAYQGFPDLPLLARQEDQVPGRY